MNVQLSATTAQLIIMFLHCLALSQVLEKFLLEDVELLREADLVFVSEPASIIFTTFLKFLSFL